MHVACASEIKHTDNCNNTSRPKNYSADHSVVPRNGRNNKCIRIRVHRAVREQSQQHVRFGVSDEGNDRKHAIVSEGQHTPRFRSP